MKKENNLYEPVTDFRKERKQMQISKEKHNELYENAFLLAKQTSESEYAQNTTTWD